MNITTINRPVTLWYRKNEEGEWEYNHLEHGHSGVGTPLMQFDSQRKAWRCEWKYVYKHLTNDIPPKVI